MEIEGSCREGVRAASSEGAVRREDRRFAHAAVRKPTDAEVLVSPRLRDLISAAEFARLRGALGLSARETEYVDLAVADSRDGVIAERMGISIHTAHTHRVRLFRKLGADGMPRLLTVIFTTLLDLRSRDT
jgi:DNA-binding CsgD family transcriptional regulator